MDAHLLLDAAARQILLGRQRAVGLRQILGHNKERDALRDIDAGQLCATMKGTRGNERTANSP